MTKTETEASKWARLTGGDATDALSALVTSDEEPIEPAVSVEQDWEAGTTTVFFEDGSAVRFDGFEASEVTTETGPPRVHIDVGGWPNISGTRVVLILEPSGERDDGIPRVYTFGNVGPGCPERVYHGRHTQLCEVSTKAVPEELERIVREHTDAIIAIDESYLGTEWDGRNLRGRWDLSDEEFDHGYTDGPLAQAVAECPSYCDAADWFAGDPESVMQNARSGDIEEWVEYEVEAARSAGAYLDEDDVREWIVERLQDEGVAS